MTDDSDITRDDRELAVHSAAWDVHLAALRLGEPDRGAGRRDVRFSRAFGPFLELVPAWLATGGRSEGWRDLEGGVPLVDALQRAWTTDPMSAETRRLAAAVLGAAALHYPTASVRALDAEAPRTVVERWHCRAGEARWTVAIEWTPPWLPTARVVRATDLPPKEVRPGVVPWNTGNPRTDLLQTASGLHRYTTRADAIDVRVLRARWPDVPILAEEVACLRDGQPATWSIRIGPPVRVREGWRVEALIDGLACAGTGRSPVMAVLSVLPSVVRDLDRVRGLADSGFAERVRGRTPGPDDLLPDADAVERWIARDGTVWPVAVCRPDVRDGVGEARIAFGGEVRAVHGDDTGQAWSLAAKLLAELREHVGVVASEVVRRPTGEGPWARYSCQDSPCLEILGALRTSRGGAAVDLAVRVGAEVDRREVHDQSPLLALVAAGEVVHARISEWLAFP